MLPAIAVEEQEAGVTPQTQETLEVIEPEDIQKIDNKVQDRDLIPLPEQVAESKYKEPVSKKNLVKKFIIAMLCVVGTSIFLYVSLSVYNKIRDGVLAGSQPPAEGEQQLSSSNDLTEAIKTFIDKTRWS